MNKTIPTVMTVSALALVLGACSPEHKMHPKNPGAYESTETSTDAKGTRTVKTSTTEISVDEDGNRSETITSKTTRDPEGLGNKTSKKSKKNLQEKY